MLLARRCGSRWCVVRWHGRHIHRTAAVRLGAEEPSPFAAKHRELKALERAVTAAATRVDAASEAADRLMKAEEVARKAYFERRRASQEANAELASRRAVLSAGLARATEAAVELVGLALKTTEAPPRPSPRLANDPAEVAFAPAEAPAPASPEPAPESREPAQPQAVGLGEWLNKFRDEKQTEAQRKQEEEAAAERARREEVAALIASPPIPIQHPETSAVMPRIYSATSMPQVLQVWEEEGARFGWYTALEAMRRLARLEQRGGAGRLLHDDQRLTEMLDLLCTALSQGNMTSTIRLGRSSTDLIDARTAMETLGLAGTPWHELVLAAISFEGNQRVSKETEGRPGEM